MALAEYKYHEKGTTGNCFVYRQKLGDGRRETEDRREVRPLFTFYTLKSILRYEFNK